MIIDITYVNSSIQEQGFTMLRSRLPSTTPDRPHSFTFTGILIAIVIVSTGCGGMNGTYIEPSKGPRGLCSLIVDNNFSSDIVIKLYEVRDPTQALHYMYVSGKSTAVVEGIAPGNLMMRYSMGREWDKTKKMFLHDRANFETDQVFKFEQSETEVSTSDGIRKEKHWSVQQLKLNANGVEGNVTTSQIDDDEFQDRK